MAVLVEGMEMPKRCGECPCFHAENPMYCQAVKADKNKKIIAPYGKPRPEWCPLIPVPPHGDLIDRDALLDTATIHWSQTTNESCFPIDEIEYAPTVIPASEEGE